MDGRPKRSSYDVVVVGGGHNGLVAAAYLARAGLSCLVLERRAAVGGAAVSERVFAGVDARLSRYAYLVSLLPRRIVDDLDLRGVRLIPRAVASYTPDPRDPTGGLLVMDGDDGATRASFAAIGADFDFDAFARFQATVRRLAERVFPTLLEPLRSRAQMRRLVADDATWDALVETPLGATVRAAIADDLVRGLVLTDGLIGTFASADAPDLPQNRCYLYHVIGGGTGRWDVPAGGMGAIASALHDAARRAGAEILTNAEVTAVGGGEVHCDGTAIGARWILANVAPAELDRLRGQQPAHPGADGAQLKVNLLVDRLPHLRDPEVAPERAFAGTFHVNETATQLETALAQAAAGQIPELAPCEIYCHTLSDRSILTGGGHTLTIFALHMPARLFDAGDGARERARDAVLRSLDSVLAEPIAERIVATPAGEPCIEVLSPLDVERELRMPRGNIFHGALEWPFVEDEDDTGTWGVETDDPAILVCGAGARRGGGISGIGGHNAAMAVITRAC